MDNENNVLEFKLDLVETPVTIGGDDYMIVELDGKERDKYLTGISARVKTSADGKSGTVKNFDGLQASLVAASLWKLDSVNGERSRVKASTIQAWPARVVSGLHDAAKQVSNIKDDEEDEDGEEKND